MRINAYVGKCYFKYKIDYGFFQVDSLVKEKFNGFYCVMHLFNLIKLGFWIHYNIEKLKYKS